MSNGHRHIHALPNGYTLHWYEIEGILGQGGFGITYLARDTNLNQSVAIKEFLPTELAVRDQTDTVQPVSGGHQDNYIWGLSRFIKEAQTLARFKHPNIVAVNAVFEENNTAYMVMEYVEGETFEDAVRDRRLRSEEELLRLTFSLMDGIEQIHNAGFIHRDIKPDNIYLRNDGAPVLLDFGSARQAFGEMTKTMTALVSPGYAPYEQYDTSGETDKQGPWTDIYALGATIYRAVIGKGPADAMARVHAILEGRDTFVPAVDLAQGWFSEQFLDAIDRALAFRPRQRPQSIAEWRRMLPELPEVAKPAVMKPDRGKEPMTEAAVMPAARKDQAAGPGPSASDEAEMDMLLEADESPGDGFDLLLESESPQSETPKPQAPDFEEGTVVMPAPLLLRPFEPEADSPDESLVEEGEAQTEPSLGDTSSLDLELVSEPEPREKPEAQAERKMDGSTTPASEGPVSESGDEGMDYLDTGVVDLELGTEESEGEDVSGEKAEPYARGEEQPGAPKDEPAEFNETAFFEAPAEEAAAPEDGSAEFNETAFLEAPAEGAAAPEDGSAEFNETAFFEAPAEEAAAPEDGSVEFNETAFLEAPAEEAAAREEAFNETAILESPVARARSQDEAEQPQLDPDEEPTIIRAEPLIQVANEQQPSGVAQGESAESEKAEDEIETIIRAQPMIQQPDDDENVVAAPGAPSPEPAVEPRAVASTPSAKAETAPRKRKTLIIAGGIVGGVLVASGAWYALNPPPAIEEPEPWDLEQVQGARELAEGEDDEAALQAILDAEEQQELMDERARGKSDEKEKRLVPKKLTGALAKLRADQEASRREQEQASQGEAEQEESARLEEEARQKEEQAELERKRLEEEEQRKAATDAKLEAEEAAREDEERLEAERKRTEKEAQQRQADEAAVQEAEDKSARVENMLVDARSHIDALRLSSPPGRNAFEILQSVLELDPDNAEARQSLVEIANKYLELAEKASAKGRFEKAEAYLQRADTVLPGSEMVAFARDELDSSRAEAQARAAEAVEPQPEQPAAQAVVEQPVEVAKLDVCAPRRLDPRPSAFPGVIPILYSHPAFQNVPAPKVKWARYRYTSVINERAREELISRYELVDADGVSAKLRKGHERSFDNGAGTASFTEEMNGTHVQVLGGLLTPIDELRAVRETSAVKDGVTQTTSSVNDTKTMITRIYEVSGQLFPLVVGNTFSYKGDTRVESNGGASKVSVHQGKPNVYHVDTVVPGNQVDRRLSCNVFVLRYTFERSDYRNVGELYFSQELGLIAKQVGDSVSTLSDGRAISRHYERALLDFQLN